MIRGSYSTTVLAQVNTELLRCTLASSGITNSGLDHPPDEKPNQQRGRLKVRELGSQ